MNSDDPVATVLIAACLACFVVLLLAALMEALP
jgi:hypothetical protein